MSAYTLSLPNSLRADIERLAAADDTSPEAYILAALAEKVSAVRTASYFERRAAAAVPGGMRGVLDRVPDMPPMPGDELPR